MSDRIESKSTPAAAATESHSSFIDDVMQHTSNTWSNVTSGNASATEYLEAGAEVGLGIAVIAAAKRFSGITRIVTTEAPLGAELLATRGIPITAASRASVLNHALLSPEMRAAAVKADLASLGLLSGEAATSSLVSSGIPISAAARELALTPGIAGLPIHLRGSAMRAELIGSGKLVTEHGLQITPAARGAATEALANAGIPITEATRAAAVNPAIASMHPSLRGDAIRSLAATDALMTAGVPINVATREAPPIILSLGPAPTPELKLLLQQSLGTDALLTRSIPINPVTRALVASPAIAELPVAVRADALRNALKLVP